MEKIKIKSCIAKEWQGKTFYNIQTEDGRGGSSSDVEFLNLIGKEIECEVKDSGKEYQNIKQYYFNLPKPPAQGKTGFAPKDWVYEKRKASLDFATRHDNIGADPLVIAEKYFQYLNKK